MHIIYIPVCLTPPALRPCPPHPPSTSLVPCLPAPSPLFLYTPTLLSPYFPTLPSSPLHRYPPAPYPIALHSLYPALPLLPYTPTLPPPTSLLFSRPYYFIPLSLSSQIPTPTSLRPFFSPSLLKKTDPCSSQ